MKEALINIAIAMFFITKNLLKTGYIKTKKAIPCAWSFVVKAYNNSLLAFFIIYVVVCLLIIETFEKKED